MLKTVKKIENFLGYFSKAFGLVAVAALTFNIFLIVFDVFSRYVLKSSVVGSSEYVSVAETMVIFFALAYTHHYQGLVHVTFFMKKFPKITPVVLWCFHEWCGAFVTVLLTYASWLQMALVEKTKMATTALLIPYYPFYTLMTIGMAAYAVVQIFSAVTATLALFNKDVQQDVIENWPA